MEAPFQTPAGERSVHRSRDSESRATTLTGTVFARLRSDIIGGKLAPDQKLGFSKLRAIYGAGTSPLREALMMLAADGLVVQEAQRGFRVAPVTLDDLHDVAELRARLERDAFVRAVERGGDDWEAAIVAAFHRLKKADAALAAAGAEAQMSENEWEARHRAFHAALTSASGSPWILRTCERLHDHTERYRRTFWTYRDRAEDAATDHRLQTEAALARDAERAGALIEAHVLSQAELTAAAMRKLGYKSAARS
jgi:DNA-binding GntR family transcriptional regulator